MKNNILGSILEVKSNQREMTPMPYKSGLDSRRPPLKTPFFNPYQSAKSKKSWWKLALTALLVIVFSVYVAIRYF